MSNREQVLVVVYQHPFDGAPTTTYLDAGLTVADYMMKCDAMPKPGHTLSVYLDAKKLTVAEMAETYVGCGATIKCAYQPRAVGVIFAGIFGALFGSIGGGVTAGGIIGAALTGGLTAAGYAALAAAVVLTAGIYIGGAMLLSMAINAIVAPPKQGNFDGLNSAQSPSLRGANNEIRKGAPIPEVFGEYRYRPPLGSAPFTEVVGADQYIRAMYCFGRGVYRLRNLRIGDVPIDSFEDIEYVTHDGTGAFVRKHLDKSTTSGSYAETSAPRLQLIVSDTKEENPTGTQGALFPLRYNNGNPNGDPIVVEHVLTQDSDEFDIELTWQNGLARWDSKGRGPFRMYVKFKFEAVKVDPLTSAEIGSWVNLLATADAIGRSGRLLGSRLVGSGDSNTMATLDTHWNFRLNMILFDPAVDDWYTEVAPIIVRDSAFGQPRSQRYSVYTDDPRIPISQDIRIATDFDYYLFDISNPRTNDNRRYERRLPSREHGRGYVTRPTNPIAKSQLPSRKIRLIVVSQSDEPKFQQVGFRPGDVVYTSGFGNSANNRIEGTHPGFLVVSVLPFGLVIDLNGGAEIVEERPTTGTQRVREAIEPEARIEMWGSSSETIRQGFHFKAPNGFGRYKLRVTQFANTNRHPASHFPQTRGGTSNKVQMVGDVTWIAARAIAVGASSVTLPGLCMVEVRGRASDQFQGVIQTLNAIALRCLPTYDNAATAWTDAPGYAGSQPKYKATRNPAWAAAWVLRRGTEKGRVIPDARISGTSFLALADFCEPTVATVTATATAGATIVTSSSTSFPATNQEIAIELNNGDYHYTKVKQRIVFAVVLQDAIPSATGSGKAIKNARFSYDRVFDFDSNVESAIAEILSSCRAFLRRTNGIYEAFLDDVRPTVQHYGAANVRSFSWSRAYDQKIHGVRMRLTANRDGEWLEDVIFLPAFDSNIAYALSPGTFVAGASEQLTITAATARIVRSGTNRRTWNADGIVPGNYLKFTGWLNSSNNGVKFISRLIDEYTIELSATGLVGETIDASSLTLEQTEATITEGIELPGITSPAQAMQLGQWILTHKRLRAERFTFETDVQGIASPVGSRIDVAHPTIRVGTGWGRVIGVRLNGAQTHVDSVVLDKPVSMLAGGSYALRIRTLNGATSLFSTYPVNTENGDRDVLTFTTPIIINGNQPKADDTFSFGDSGVSYLDAIVLETKGLGDLGHRFTCVPYAGPALFDPAFSVSPQPDLRINATTSVDSMPPAPPIIRTVRSVFGGFDPSGNHIIRVEVLLAPGVAAASERRSLASQLEVQWRYHSVSSNLQSYHVEPLVGVDRQAIMLGPINPAETHIDVRVRAISQKGVGSAFTERVNFEVRGSVPAPTNDTPDEIEDIAAADHFEVLQFVEPYAGGVNETTRIEWLSPGADSWAVKAFKNDDLFLTTVLGVPRLELQNLTIGAIYTIEVTPIRGLSIGLTSEFSFEHVAAPGVLVPQRPIGLGLDGTDDNISTSPTFRWSWRPPATITGGALGTNAGAIVDTQFLGFHLTLKDSEGGVIRVVPLFGATIYEYPADLNRADYTRRTNEPGGYRAVTLEVRTVNRSMDMSDPAAFTAFNALPPLPLVRSTTQVGSSVAFSFETAEPPSDFVGFSLYAVAVTVGSPAPTDIALTAENLRFSGNAAQLPPLDFDAPRDIYYRLVAHDTFSGFDPRLSNIGPVVFALSTAAQELPDGSVTSPKLANNAATSGALKRQQGREGAEPGGRGIYYYDHTYWNFSGANNHVGDGIVREVYTPLGNTAIEIRASIVARNVDAFDNWLYISREYRGTIGANGAAGDAHMIVNAANNLGPTDFWKATPGTLTGDAFVWLRPASTTPNTGQYRRIVGSNNTTKRIDVDTPWAAGQEPAVGDEYVLFYVLSYTFTGTPAAGFFYYGITALDTPYAATFEYALVNWSESGIIPVVDSCDISIREFRDDRS